MGEEHIVARDGINPVSLDTLSKCVHYEKAKETELPHWKQSI